MRQSSHQPIQIWRCRVSGQWGRVRAAELLETISRQSAETPISAYTLWTFLTIWLAENTAQNAWDDLRAEIDRDRGYMTGRVHA